MAWLLVGCAPAHDIAIDVRTDLVAGVDFIAVRLVLISDADSSPLDTELRPADPDDGWISGTRAGYFVAPAGVYWVRAELLDRQGEVAAERLMYVEVAHSQIATVLITQSCEDIACPREGDPPNAVACHGGQCVDPACTPESPETCPEPECLTDDDCDAGVVCGEGTCAADLCWFAPGPAACPSGQHCRPEVGCSICDADGCTPAP